ncbi:hypothetical protein BC941DRAFT_433506 [Chlamydoabsidia padenii]|nr:hypothetical protein BC941DRAFT_433506 [Chlamydoabsidia padenii]
MPGCSTGGHFDIATSHRYSKPIIAAIVIRMIMASIVVFIVYGSALSKDPMYIVMMIILGSTPTAINLIQISQVTGMFEEEMLHVLFWSYGVVCIPVVILVVFLALSVMDCIF